MIKSFVDTFMIICEQLYMMYIENYNVSILYIDNLQQILRFVIGLQLMTMYVSYENPVVVGLLSVILGNPPLTMRCYAQFSPRL